MTHSIRGPIARNLRTSLTLPNGDRIRSQHSYEITAAFFGYNSDAALLSDVTHNIDRIEEGRFLIPDVPKIVQVLNRLYAIPLNEMFGYRVASHIAEFCRQEEYFTGQIWVSDTQNSAIIENIYDEFGGVIDDELSGEMATTNAYFTGLHLEEGIVTTHNGEMSFQLSGIYESEQMENKPFSGGDLSVVVIGHGDLTGGRICVEDLAIEVGGDVNDFH